MPSAGEVMRLSCLRLHALCMWFALQNTTLSNPNGFALLRLLFRDIFEA